MAKKAEKVRKSDMIEFMEKKTLQFLSAGLFQGEKPWIHDRRVIDSYEIIFMLDGDAYIREDEIEYELHPGDIFLLRPFHVHEGSRISAPPPRFYWMHFLISDPELLEFKHLNINETVQSDNITFYFSQLLHTTTSPFYDASSSDALTLLIISYLNVCVKTMIDRSDRLVNEMMEYIRGSLPQVQTVQSVSRHFGYNPDYLSTLFRTKTGMGLKEYLDKSRINYAKSLLMSSSYSIKEIAAQLGFASPQHFIGFFKYHEGISPLKYKNRSISTHINMH